MSRECMLGRPASLWRCSGSTARRHLLLGGPDKALSGPLRCRNGYQKGTCCPLAEVPRKMTNSAASAAQLDGPGYELRTDPRRYPVTERAEDPAAEIGIGPAARSPEQTSLRNRSYAKQARYQLRRCGRQRQSGFSSKSQFGRLRCGKLRNVKIGQHGVAGAVHGNPSINL